MARNLFRTCTCTACACAKMGKPHSPTTRFGELKKGSTMADASWRKDYNNAGHGAFASDDHVVLHSAWFTKKVSPAKHCRGARFRLSKATAAPGVRATAAPAPASLRAQRADVISGIGSRTRRSRRRQTTRRLLASGLPRAAAPQAHDIPESACQTSDVAHHRPTRRGRVLWREGLTPLRPHGTLVANPGGLRVPSCCWP